MFLPIGDAMQRVLILICFRNNRQLLLSHCFKVTSNNNIERIEFGFILRVSRCANQLEISSAMFEALQNYQHWYANFKLQSFTKYLRQTLVVIWNSALLDAFCLPKNPKCASHFKLQCTCYYTTSLRHWKWVMISFGKWF